MVVDTLHVVKQVISPWEAIARDTTVATRIVAQMWPLTVSVHSVCFSFMSKEAGGGRELLLGTGLDLAPERLQVRIDVFAARTQVVST